MANPSPTLPPPTSPAPASRPPSSPSVLGSDAPLIPLDFIAESKTNPRKTRNADADRELVESVRAWGVLQPVLVRPLPATAGKTYELVVGSRRFRAAQAAGLSRIPATMRQLTDEQVLEIQIIENLQREDVAPIDEGRGYRDLLEMRAKAKPKANRQDLVVAIANEVGKSARYVYARMKLGELLPDLQKDLEEGRIEASHADELVRLTPKDQKDIRASGLYMDEPVEEPGATEPARYAQPWNRKNSHRAISVRNLKVVIERDYQLTLDKAKFPIDSIVLKPVACTACPKNTAVNPLLPAAAKATCTDKECWRGKQHQWVEIQAKKLAEKASSPKLVQIALSHHTGNAEVLARPDWKTAKPGECDGVRAAMQVDLEGWVRHYQLAKHVCVNKKCKVHFAAKSAASSHAGTSAPAKKLTLEQLKETHKVALDEYIAEREPLEQVRRVVGKVGKLGAAELRLLAILAADSFYHDEGKDELAHVLGLKPAIAARKLAGAATVGELPRVIVALLCVDLLERHDVPELGAYAKAQGLNAANIRIEIRAGVRTCEVCGCFDQHGCDLGGGKRCSFVTAQRNVCSNPQCVAEARKREGKAAKPPALQSSAKPRKKPPAVAAGKAVARKKGGRR